MAHIRRSVWRAAYRLLALISFLFSAGHLATPSWANARGDVPSTSEDLTALIADLSQAAEFDRSLTDELERFQILAQSTPDVELAPLDKLAPSPGTTPQPAPGTAQPQQAYIDDDWLSRGGRPPEATVPDSQAPQQEQAITWVPCYHATPEITTPSQQQPVMPQPQQALLSR